MSLMEFFCDVLFSPRDVLDEIWDLIESVSEGFPTYFFYSGNLEQCAHLCWLIWVFFAFIGDTTHFRFTQFSSPLLYTKQSRQRFFSLKDNYTSCYNCVCFRRRMTSKARFSRKIEAFIIQKHIVLQAYPLRIRIATLQIVILMVISTS